MTKPINKPLIVEIDNEILVRIYIKSKLSQLGYRVYDNDEIKSKDYQMTLQDLEKLVIAQIDKMGKSINKLSQLDIKNIVYNLTGQIAYNYPYFFIKI